MAISKRLYAISTLLFVLLFNRKFSRKQPKSLAYSENLNKFKITLNYFKKTLVLIKNVAIIRNVLKRATQFMYILVAFRSSSVGRASGC